MYENVCSKTQQYLNYTCKMELCSFLHISNMSAKTSIKKCINCCFFHKSVQFTAHIVDRKETKKSLLHGGAVYSQVRNADRTGHRSFGSCYYLPLPRFQIVLATVTIMHNTMTHAVEVIPGQRT